MPKAQAQVDPRRRRPSTPRTSSPSPRVAEKREKRRAEILQAALRAFGEKGYHRTTLDDIAEHLGVRKTALYHYFPDKEAILYECHRQSLAELARILRQAGKLPSPTAQLEHIVREHVRVMTDTLQGSPLAFEVTALSEEKQADMIAGRDRYERRLRRTRPASRRSTNSWPSSGACRLPSGRYQRAIQLIAPRITNTATLASPFVKSPRRMPSSMIRRRPRS